jgi:phage-related protein
LETFEVVTLLRQTSKPLLDVEQSSRPTHPIPPHDPRRSRSDHAPLAQVFGGLQLAKGERPLDWIGSSKKDFLAFPEPVKDEMGNALGLAQFGVKHPKAKPWKGQGPGVFEIVEDHHGDACRAIYTVRFREVVYVLHAFQKKSPKGVRMARTDVALVRQRLGIAQRDHEAHHGKA